MAEILFRIVTEADYLERMRVITARARPQMAAFARDVLEAIRQGREAGVNPATLGEAAINTIDTVLKAASGQFEAVDGIASSISGDVGHG